MNKSKKKMSRKKAFEIGDLMAGGHNNAIAHALYISAKGTNHFYEALELLAKHYPETGYSDEFEELKKNYEENSIP